MERSVRTGLENAGFTTVFVNELDKDAMATYLRNRGHELGGMRFSDNADLRCHDAHELKGKRLEKLVSDLGSMSEVDLRFEQASLGKLSNLDLVAGGPPCQGYSGIGIRRSYAVDKEALPSNRLYARMTKIIDRLRPRMFLFENVRGLLTSRWTREGSRKIFPDVLEEFRKIPGYEVRWSLVYAKDYGVPQNRPRVLLVGIRKDVLEACSFLDKDADAEDAVACGFLPPPNPGAFPDLVDLLGDLIDPKITKILRSGEFPAGSLETTAYPRKPMNELQEGFRTPPAWAVARAGKLTEQEYSKHKREIVEKFDYMLANGGEIPAHPLAGGSDCVDSCGRQGGDRRAGRSRWNPYDFRTNAKPRLEGGVFASKDGCGGRIKSSLVARASKDGCGDRHRSQLAIDAGKDGCGRVQPSLLAVQR